MAAALRIIVALILVAFAVPARAAESAAVEQPPRHRHPDFRHRPDRPGACRSRSGCGCGWRRAGTPTGATPAMPGSRRSCNCPAGGRQRRADRVAGAAAPARRAADDLRLQRRDAAGRAGHRSRPHVRLQRPGWCARRSACRRRAISASTCRRARPPPRPRRRCSPPPRRRLPRPSPWSARVAPGRHADLAGEASPAPPCATPGSSPPLPTRSTGPARSRCRSGDGRFTLALQAGGRRSGPMRRSRACCWCATRGWPADARWRCRSRTAPRRRRADARAAAVADLGFAGCWAGSSST